MAERNLTSKAPAVHAMGAEVTWATTLALVEAPSSMSILHSVKEVAPALVTFQVMLPWPPETFCKT